MQNKRIAICARVSADKRKVDMQLAKLREFIQRSGPQLSREYIDQGYCWRKRLTKVRRSAIISLSGSEVMLYVVGEDVAAYHEAVRAFCRRRPLGAGHQGELATPGIWKMI